MQLLKTQDEVGRLRVPTQVPLPPPMQPGLRPGLKRSNECQRRSLCLPRCNPCKTICNSTGNGANAGPFASPDATAQALPQLGGYTTCQRRSLCLPRCNCPANSSGDYRELRTHSREPRRSAVTGAICPIPTTADSLKINALAGARTCPGFGARLRFAQGAIYGSMSKGKRSDR